MGWVHVRTERACLVILGLTISMAMGCAGTAPAVGDGSGSKGTVSDGFRDMERRNVTGSISSLSDEDIKNSHAFTVEEMIAGRVPGVEVRQTQNGFSVRMRGVRSIAGNNEPLYIVDGMPLMPSANGLIPVDPHDVVSIDVLRGAAAAVYGWSAGNGVIVINTRSPR